MRRNKSSCCRQVVNLLYTGVLPADSQPPPTVRLAVSFQDKVCRCSLQTRLKPVYQKSRGSCALGRAREQRHHSNSGFLIRLARSLVGDLRRVVFPLSLFPKLVRVSDHVEEHDDIGRVLKLGFQKVSGRANFALFDHCLYTQNTAGSGAVFYWAPCNPNSITLLSSKHQPGRSNNQMHLLAHARYLSI